MTQDQFLEHLSKETLLQEYHYLEGKKADILQAVRSNHLSIENQFINMELLVDNGLNDIEDLIEMEMCLARVNTFIAMAFLNDVEDNEVEFKYLTRLPSLFFKLHMNKLRILKSITIDGRNNHLSNLPAEIGFLMGLEILNLKHCSLKVLPKEIGLLKSLHLFNLDYNEMDALPPEICDLVELQELHLRHNHLHDLPLALTRLAKLRSIDIQENDIDKLPEAFSPYIH
ncbi:MAG: leucine-rich repeat domain-containing protein [Candidatus Berkiella sp.]